MQVSLFIMCAPNRSELQAIPLPEGLHATSSDVIANLNEHLIQTLHQLDAKDKKVAELATELTVSVHLGRFSNLPDITYSI
jgi:hypothetical protein